MTLSMKREKELIRRAKSGDKEAMEKLLEAHKGYLYQLAKKYISEGIEIEDLISVGFLALMEAIERFDLNKDVKLLTYASYYIENAMKNYVLKLGYSVKITLDHKEKLAKIYKAIEEFKEKNGREPTIEEIAEELNIKPETVRRALNQYKGEFSIDEFYEDDERPMEEVLEDPKQLELDKEIEDRLEKLLYIMKRVLKEDEFKVVKEYYGILTEKKTFEEIGKELGISKERVRQIKEKAIRRLKFIYSDLIKKLFYD